MVFEDVDAPRHFNVNAPWHFLEVTLSRMIGMTTCQRLSSCPAVRQIVPMPRAHSEFFYLYFGGENKSATVK